VLLFDRRGRRTHRIGGTTRFALQSILEAFHSESEIAAKRSQFRGAKNERDD
jgi:hypothetical protein